MIPPEYLSVAVRLARLGRNDAYALCEAAMAAGVPALDLLCNHLDATLARYRALPALSLSNGPTRTSTAALPNCASAPKMPAKAACPEPVERAQPAQAPAKHDPAPSVTMPTVPGHVEGPNKHGADDAAKRAALRAAMAEAPNPPSSEPNPPSSEPNPPTSEPIPDTVVEPEQAPIHQLPSRPNMGELYLDSVSALSTLGYCKSEARRMARAAVEAGAQDIGQVIKACTRKAK